MFLKSKIEIWLSLASIHIIVWTVPIARVVSEYVQTIEMGTWDRTLLMRRRTLDPGDWGHLSQLRLIKRTEHIQYIEVGFHRTGRVCLDCPPKIKAIEKIPDDSIETSF